MEFSSPTSQPQQASGGYYGDASGMGSPNNMVLQMGLSYGQTILNQSLQRGEQSLSSSYLPIVTKLKRYFCVDSVYVRKKLGILAFPFTRRFPPTVPSGGGETLGGGQDAHANSVFGGSSDDAAGYNQGFGSPTLEHPNAAGGVGSTNGVFPRLPPAVPLPTSDVLAFDLYIPLMGSITYVIISAFLYGLLHKGTVKSDNLLATASVVIFWLALEMTALKLLAYVLHVVHGGALLDIASLCGYKFSLVCMAVLLRQTLHFSGSLYYIPMIIYVASTNGFLTVKTLMRLSAREDGRVPPRARLYAYLSALAQTPAIIWLCLRPFYS